MTIRRHGPEDQSLYRNGWGKFKPRAKIHLVRPSLQGCWVATGLVGPDGFSALGDTAREAWEAVAAKQKAWWDSLARRCLRDVP